MFKIFWKKVDEVFLEVVESGERKNKWIDFINYIGKNLDRLCWEEVELLFY